MILSALVALLLLAALSYLIHLHLLHRRFSHIPGPPRPSFLFGHALQFKARVKESGTWGMYWMDLYQQYGGTYITWFGPRPLVFTTDPETLKEMAADVRKYRRAKLHEDAKINLPFTKNFKITLEQIGSQRLLGEHSILTDYGGPIWKRKKRVMDPVFTLQKLAAHLPRFIEIADELTDVIQCKVGESAEKVLDFALIFAPYAINAISRAGFNAPADKEAQLQNFANGLKDVMTNLLSSSSHPIMHFFNPKSRKAIEICKANVSVLRETGKQLMVERIASGGGAGQPEDVLDAIISANVQEDSELLDTESALDDFMAMYLAGNATTKISACWILSELVRHPEVMAKLVTEVDEIWCSGEAITSETSGTDISERLKSMEYLESVVKETLRIHPVVQTILRKLLQDAVVDGYQLPRGTVVHSSQYVIHRLEGVWEEPERYNPDRWSKGFIPAPFTYLPFFAGPRRCIGRNFAMLELKCILCELLKKFTIGGTDMGPIRSQQGVLCFPVGNNFSFEPRVCSS